MPFLKNTWYMAAWATEISDKLMSRKILGESVLMYRGEEGQIIAMGDICPHRFASLHLGKRLPGDIVECPYHGLRFGKSGACVHNPHGDKKIPATARVKTYPIVERYGIVWLWPGRSELQNPDVIPDYSFLDNDGGWVFTNGQVQTFGVPMDLILDNLMDLSHAAYLHPMTVGSEAVSRGTMKVEEWDERTIMVRNWYPNGVPSNANVLSGAAKPDEIVDMWVDVRLNLPSAMFFDTGVVLTGESREKKGKSINSAQLLTPESDQSTHYFWKAFMNYGMESPVVIAAIEQAISAAFSSEDEPMIKNIHENMAGREFWSMNPVLLQTDAAAVRLRRLLASAGDREKQDD